MLRKKLGGTLTKPYFTWIESNFPKNMIESKRSNKKMYPFFLSFLINVSLLFFLSFSKVLDEIKFYPYPVKMQQRLDHLREKNAKVTERYLLDQKRTYSISLFLPFRRTEMEMVEFVDRGKSREKIG